METQPHRNPEAGGGESAEVEDIPSDFFDGFNADFIEGLSVIDSWDDRDKAIIPSKNEHPRFNAEAFDKVKDLRELMSDDKTSADRLRDDRRNQDTQDDRRYKQRRSSSINRLDEFIKPGSRRDPNKTNEAIKRDKEEKVKEFLAKSLESSADDLRPPGTELDDYFEGSKAEKRSQIESSIPPKQRSRSRERRKESPRKLQQHPRRNSPKWSPKRSPMRRKVSRSPRRTATWRPNSPLRNSSFSFNRLKRFSPQRDRRYPSSPQRRSPRRSPQRSALRSPRRSPLHSPRRSPLHSSRRSPHRSVRYFRRSHSKSPIRRHRSRSPSNRDNFLYPEQELRPNYGPSQAQYQMPHQYVPPNDYPGGPHSGYPSYAPAYGGYSAPYDYRAPMPVAQIQPFINLPASVPNPVPAPVPNPILPPTGHVPVMVPAPSMPMLAPAKQASIGTPYDALAKLVAEGKISKEDYLKLAPNKGTISTPVNDKNRVMVLNRCSTALLKLKSLELPNYLLFNHGIDLEDEPKYIGPKFCSPLKRQAPVEFQYTSANGPSSSYQNKLLIDSIIAALGLDKVISRPKKKTSKNTKDAACQTTKPFCDECEIRAATTTREGATSIDREHISSSVHTQVVEQDLVSSKSIFNPSGSVGEGASMSIAHLTPAQLVSQLAARAKTLKNPVPAPDNQYRRNDYNYDYDNRGGQNQQYQKYNNFRY